MLELWHFAGFSRKKENLSNVLEIATNYGRTPNNHILLAGAGAQVMQPEIKESQISGKYPNLILLPEDIGFDVGISQHGVIVVPHEEATRSYDWHGRRQSPRSMAWPKKINHNLTPKVWMQLIGCLGDYESRFRRVRGAA